MAQMEFDLRSYSKIVQVSCRPGKEKMGPGGGESSRE